MNTTTYRSTATVEVAIFDGENQVEVMAWLESLPIRTNAMFHPASPGTGSPAVPPRPAVIRIGLPGQADKANRVIVIEVGDGVGHMTSEGSSSIRRIPKSGLGTDWVPVDDEGPEANQTNNQEDTND